MTLFSMTGFARVAGSLSFGKAEADWRWVWEIKTVNSRSLDVKCRLPTQMEGLEPQLRTEIGAVITRGSCQVQLQLSRTGGTNRLVVNEVVLSEAYQAVNSVAKRLGADTVPIAALLNIRGILDFEERADNEAVIAALQKAIFVDLKPALTALVAVRQAEGLALATILSEKLERMALQLSLARHAPGRAAPAVKARLLATIQQITDVASQFDSERLYQEAILLAAKADICEELDRLDAHVEAARNLIAEGGPVGRRLDFLAQEFGREANTLCAKSNDISLTRTGLELKTLVEQFREQIQNVE